MRAHQLCLLFTVILTISCHSNSSDDDSTKDPSPDSIPKTITQYSPSAKEVEIREKHHELIYKTILIQTFYFSKPLDLGAAFLVKKNNFYYLATNYHLLAGCEPTDTSIIRSKTGEIPNEIHICLHTKSDIPFYFSAPLYQNGNRTFISIPPDLERLKATPREVSDLVFLPLGPNYRENVRMDTSAMSENNEVIKKDDLIAFFGFRNANIVEKQFPIVDTAKVTYSIFRKPIYSNKGKFIFFNAHKPFEGNSGCPVYIEINNKLRFIGIVSGKNNIPKFFSDNSANQMLGNIISKSFIHYALEKYVP